MSDFRKTYRWPHDPSIYSQGRNGPADTVGLSVGTYVDGIVDITPLTRRNGAQNCWIKFPQDVMTELAIDWLTATGHTVIRKEDEAQ